MLDEDPARRSTPAIAPSPGAEGSKAVADSYPQTDSDVELGCLGSAGGFAQIIR